MTNLPSLSEGQARLLVFAGVTIGTFLLWQNTRGIRNVAANVAEDFVRAPNRARNMIEDFTKGVDNAARGVVNAGKNVMTGSTVGMRNKNPGNIRATFINWQGETAESRGRETGFTEFENMFYGSRALLLNLYAQYRKDNPPTLTTVINRWAPPNENDTQNYVRFVSDETNIPLNEPLNFTNRSQVAAIARAITIMENGLSVVQNEAPELLDSLYWQGVYNAAFPNGIPVG